MDATIIFAKLFVLIVQRGLLSVSDAIRVALHRRTYRVGDSPKNVLVIGSSFSGHNAAKILANSLPSGYRVIIVEKHDRFQFIWALPRFSVISGLEYRAFVPLNKYLEKVLEGSHRLIHDEAIAIHGKQLILGSG